MQANTPEPTPQVDADITNAFVAKGASSFDPRFPPQNALDDPADPRSDRFWTTLGLYPQFVNISLQDKFSSSNITHLCIELLSVRTLKIIFVDNSHKTVCDGALALSSTGIVLKSNMPSFS